MVTPFQVDHIIAEAHGGETHLNNLAWACYECNNYKGPNVAGFDLSSREVVRLYNPRADVWRDHFALLPSGEITASTDIGRVTVNVLRMNQPRLVLTRGALVREGLMRAGENS